MPRIRDLVKNIFHAIPAGVGSEGAISKLGRDEMKEMIQTGAKWAVDKGYGYPEDLERMARKSSARASGDAADRIAAEFFDRRLFRF